MPLKVLEAHRNLADTLKQIAHGSRLPLERERTAYLAGHLGFAVPYADSLTTACDLQLVLDSAEQLKATGQNNEARQKVAAEAVPLWLKLAAQVRETMIIYQSIVGNRGDLGQLASMHDKYVRLALFRLPLSIEEYIGYIPFEMSEALEQTLKPPNDAARGIFIPTCPSMLRSGEQFRILVVATGTGAVEEISVHTRFKKESSWQQVTPHLKGRRTYGVSIGPFDVNQHFAEYYASAQIEGKTYVTPATAPYSGHAVTLF